MLLETPLSATMFTGYTKQYLPVLVSAPGHKTGDVVEVTLGTWDRKRCRAESRLIYIDCCQLRYSCSM